MQSKILTFRRVAPSTLTPSLQSRSNSSTLPDDVRLLIKIRRLKLLLPGHAVVLEKLLDSALSDVTLNRPSN